MIALHRLALVGIPHLLSVVFLTDCSSQHGGNNAQVRQNPSPMVDHTRLHQRIGKQEFPGRQLAIDGHLTQPVEVYIPEDCNSTDDLKLLIHFHGAAFVPMYAVHMAEDHYVLAVINLGAGSSVYESAFLDPITFQRLVSTLSEQVKEEIGAQATVINTYISAFSAGYGAVRAILREEDNYREVDGVILLDGLHTSYMPEYTVLADGGRLDTTKLEPFLRLARSAVQGPKTFLLTHSEIFPGTYASTTETADYLIQSLGLKRTPVVKWGPLGMQHLSEVIDGRFRVLGFAGNSAPDHIDHYHALYYFLRVFSEGKSSDEKGLQEDTTAFGFQQLN